MNLDEVAEMTKSFEGGYADEVYLDSEGVPTGGYGHAFLVGSKIPLVVANALFRMDFITAVEDYQTLNLDLDNVRRAVVIDMLYNMGLTNFLTFQEFLKCARSEDWNGAAKEMLNSKWAGQVKTRAVKLAKMMRTGEYHGVD